MRIDRVRLDQGSFPYSYEMQTRYGDIDQIGHVNNVATIALLQEGRNRFYHGRQVLSEDLSCDMVVAGMNVDFAADLFHPQPVTVDVGVLDLGRTSFRLGQIIRQNGRVAVYAEVVQVARNAAGPVPLPPSWRAKLERLYIQPQQG